jgi:hypothetical protein
LLQIRHFLAAFDVLLDIPEFGLFGADSAHGELLTHFGDFLPKHKPTNTSFFD